MRANAPFLVLTLALGPWACDDASDANPADAAAAPGDAGGDGGDTRADAAAPGPDAEVGPATCTAARTSVDGRGVRISYACTDGALRGAVALFPVARIDGAWRGGGADGACTASGFELVCPAGEAGRLIATVARLQGDPTVRVRLEAASDVTVDTIGLEGAVELPGATGWLSNGLQSRSQSGVVAIDVPPDAAALEVALAQHGDLEAGRTGAELSRWYTWVGGGEAAIFAGALTSDVRLPWLQVSERADGLWMRIAAGPDPEGLAADGVAEGETFFIWAGPEADGLGATLRRYAGALVSRRTREDAPPVPPLVGWSSWYGSWSAVDEGAVRANAALAQAILAPHVDDEVEPWIVVDEGWQAGWGRWTANEKFPSGMDGLAADLVADGLRPGIWLAPLLVSESDPLVGTNPDWFVEGATYTHPTEGPMRVLDVTRPDAAAHLREVIERLTGWGYAMLKIDRLFAGLLPGRRAEAITPLESYHRALALIREAAGEETVLVAAGAPPLPSLPYVDSWRLGGDIALSESPWGWPFVANQARSVAARWPLCLATLCDADPALLRELPRPEVEAGAWVVALASGAAFLSDDLRALPEARRGWGLDAARIGLALGGVPSEPIDPFPAAAAPTLTNATVDLAGEMDSHVLPARWALPDGRVLRLNAGGDARAIDGVEVPPHSAQVSE
jgi:alpha-galactosidase